MVVQSLLEPITTAICGFAFDIKFYPEIRKIGVRIAHRANDCDRRVTGLFAEKKKAPKARKSALIKYFSILNVGFANGSEGASNRL